MMILFIFVLAIPSLAEAYTDRRGETAEGKRKDAIGLLLTALLLIIIGDTFLRVDPTKVIALLLGWRLLIFDPLVNYFLKKYSEGHKDINIWTYVGTTSKIDRFVSRVNPVVRLGVRVALFVAALVWFLV